MVGLPQKGVLDRLAEVDLGMVRHLRAGGEDRRPGRPCPPGHPAGRLAGMGEAHLVQEVELVLVKGDEARLVLVEERRELFLALGQHGVEESHRVAPAAQVARRVERAQGGVRAHLLDLLGIVLQEERMGEKDIGHRPGVLRFLTRNCHARREPSIAAGFSGGQMLLRHAETPLDIYPANVTISEVTPTINSREIRLAALRRSGSHAVVHWLLAQLPGRGVFLNSCKPGENPYSSCYRGDSVVRPAGHFDLDRAPEPKDFLLYNYEDRELSIVFSDAFDAAHDRWVGASGRPFDLLVLRDPWNNLASLLRWARGSVHPISLDSVAKAVRLWKGYAREVLGKTTHLRHTPTPVLYNRWVTDPGYREELAGRL